MSGIFKAYDIRGVYPTDINEDIAYAIGRAYIAFTGAKKVVVARDMRPHSEPLFAGLSRGLTDQGADVIDLGLASTPQSYFANGRLHADGSVMITASPRPLPPPIQFCRFLSNSNLFKVYTIPVFKHSFFFIRQRDKIYFAIQRILLFVFHAFITSFFYEQHHLFIRN